MLPTPLRWCRARAAAAASMLGSLSPRQLDDLIDLPGSEGTGAVPLRFLTDDSQHFRFRRGKTNIISNTEQDSLGSAAFLDYQGAALAFHTAEEFSEICASAQRGDNHRSVLWAWQH